MISTVILLLNLILFNFPTFTQLTFRQFRFTKKQKSYKKSRLDLKCSVSEELLDYR